MAVTREKAYAILEINRGATQDEIRSAYKKQALKWHPDKHKNSPEATKRFQEISSAYERLMKPEEVEIHLSMDEMFDLFSHVFFGHRVYRNGYFDSSDSDVEFEAFTYRPEAFNHKSSREKEVPRESRPTVSEAKQNETDLLREEEKLKRQKEKRKERKKRRKARKRQEKEVRYGGGDSKKKGKKQAAQESSDDEDDEDEDAEDLENKENIAQPMKVNNNSGDSNLNSQDKSSKTKNFSNDSKVEQTKPEIHIDHDSSHRKEIHDGEGGDHRQPEEKKNKTKKSSAKTSLVGSSDSDSDEETQGLDMNSAFFARAASGISKKQAATPTVKKEKSKKSKGSKKDESESIEDMDPTVLESRKLAVKGNEMANTGNYQAAVKFFTKAISLNPTDFRFFGNRSFCFDHLQMFDHALQDAEQAISLDKTWPKGYYRKGRALSGLKLYADAEAAFEYVLRLDKNCAEAVHELRTVRIYRLMEMGFNAQRSEAAILQFGNVQTALENLLAQGAVPENTELEEVYVSDEEDYITKTIEESKTDARNPQNLRSLWIGNLQPTVTEKELKDLFKPYGEVHSMRRMTEKYCAFVNYKDPRMASKAMDKLQGKELHGKCLLIKFPDNPIDQFQTGQQGEVMDARYKTTVLRKNNSTGNKTPKMQQQNHRKEQVDIDQQTKLSGPVNGDECFFWRTTGCWYGDRCIYKHLPQSKGLDRK